MHYRLREGLHWCECAGRIVFLDLVEDRYSCLPPHSTGTFLRLAGGQGSCDQPEWLRALIVRGMMVETRTASRWDSPVRVAPLSGDFVHEPYPAPSLVGLVQAATRQLGWGLLVRTRPLADIVKRLESQARPAGPAGRSAEERIGQIISAFAAVSGVLPAENRCLVRALALHSLCCGLGIGPALVFGVRMNPFRAHCWVQLGGKVLVGDFEQARLFTPIAAIV